MLVEEARHHYHLLRYFGYLLHYLLYLLGMLEMQYQQIYIGQNEYHRPLIWKFRS